MKDVMTRYIQMLCACLVCSLGSTLLMSYGLISRTATVIIMSGGFLIFHFVCSRFCCVALGSYRRYYVTNLIALALFTLTVTAAYCCCFYMQPKFSSLFYFMGFTLLSPGYFLEKLNYLSSFVVSIGVMLILLILAPIGTYRMMTE